MKIVREAAYPIVLFFYLTFRYFLVTSKVSSSDQQQNPSILAKPSYLVVAFTFNIIVVLLLLRTFNPAFPCPQTSACSASELYSSFWHQESHVHLPPPVTDSDGSTLAEDDDDEIDEFVPRLVYVEYKKIDDEKLGDGELAPPVPDSDGSTLAEDDDDEIDEFVPRLVYVEYKKIDDEKLGDGELDEEDDHLNQRIQDFVVANKKKWNDELLNEYPTLL